MALEARSVAVPAVGPRGRVPTRSPRHTKSVARQERVLTMATRIGAVVGGFFSSVTIFIGHGGLWIGLLSAVCSVAYLAIPALYRFGVLVASLAFIIVAYSLITVVIARVGTGSGMQFYFLVAASIVVLVLGTKHIALASTMAALGAGLTIA